jgi:hypothetical protein
MAARSRALILLAAVLATGCATTRPELRTVAVEVPVPCRVALPERPVMPTEQLTPGVPLQTAAAAALAEIDRREDYERRLLAALEECRREAIPRP